MNAFLPLLIDFLAYLLGSIPFGLVLTRLAGFGDIRQIGSGNIGATNVLRTGNKGLAAVTLFLDGAKGAAAVFLAEYFLPGSGPLAGLAALLGHIFPVWLKFKGGKGVATVIGVTLALLWPAGVAIMIMWLLVAWLSRYSSFAALFSISLLPIYAILLQRFDLLFLFAIMTFLIVAKHRENIRRLLNGTEPKIGGKNAATSS